MQARANLAAQEKAQLTQFKNVITDVSINIDDFQALQNKSLTWSSGDKAVAASECEPSDSNAKWESLYK